MAAQVFIGRKNGLDRLKALHKKKTPSLVVVKGRRRVVKSRLILLRAAHLDSLNQRPRPVAKLIS